MTNNTYYHSVTLDRGKCVGCTNCLKRCPTEAIRIRGGRAHIVDEMCIDCGECIRVCSHHAKVPLTDPLSSINRFKYRIALPAPSLYGQFKNVTNISSIPYGLKQMGFNEVFDVARGADIVTAAVQKMLDDPDCPRPLISSACPAVVRLIQVRFPELIDNLVDMRSPMEIAAMMARREFCEKNNVAPEEVGCFFITPCAAKVTAIRKPLGHEKSAIDGAISMLEIYGLLSGQLRREDVKNCAEEPSMQPCTALGIGWARSGGECTAMGQDDVEMLAVDGIEEVTKVLEAIENDRLPALRFFEGQSCQQGCVGGPMAFENPFIARNRIRRIVLNSPRLNPRDAVTDEDLAKLGQDMHFSETIEPLNTLSIDSDFKQALTKLERIEEIRKKLPGLDCGSCGSPTCQALAEDIVGGYARELDCLFLLKEQVTVMAKRMVEISELTRDK